MPSIAAGIGSIKSIDEGIVEVGLPNDVIVVSGETTYKIADKSISDNLASNGFKVDLVTIRSSPTIGNAENFLKELESKGKELLVIVSVGGGFVLDMCKYAAAKLGWPLVAISTSLSSGAITTYYSVLWDENRNWPIKTTFPSLIVGDYEILTKQPPLSQQAWGTCSLKLALFTAGSLDSGLVVSLTITLRLGALDNRFAEP